MGNEIYNKKMKKELELKRDAYKLQPLLHDIGIEQVSKNKVQNLKTNDDINFSKSFIMFSQKQIYKTYSVVGLMKCFNHNTKYFVLDLSLLLDVWFNSSLLINKSNLLNCDVLIIHGHAESYQAEHKSIALKELFSIRKTMNKITWLYIEGTNKQEFNTLYPEVVSSIGNCYNS